MQKIKAMLLCIVYAMLFVDTVNMKIKAGNALNVMLSTLLTLVFVVFTQHCIQSNEVWKLYSTLYKVASCPCQEGRLFEKPSVLWL